MVKAIPRTIPNSFEELGRILGLEEYATRYLQRRYHDPLEAINAGRALDLRDKLPTDLNNSLYSLHERLKKKGYIFNEHLFGKAIRKIAISLEPFAGLPIRLPYSTLVEASSLSEEAYASLCPLSAQQVNDVIKTIETAARTETRFKTFAYYTGLIPNSDESIGQCTKVCQKVYITSTTNVRNICTEVMASLQTPRIAKRIVYNAFSASEANFIKKRLRSEREKESNYRRSLAIDTALEMIDNHFESLSTAKKIPIEKADFSTSIFNTFTHVGCRYIEDVANIDYDDFLRIRSFSPTDQKQIVECLDKLNVFFADERFYH